MTSAEIIFKVSEAVEGGYEARARGHGIFTQGEDWADLKAMVGDAVRCHFDADARPKLIQLHLVKDDVTREGAASAGTRDTAWTRGD